MLEVTIKPLFRLAHISRCVRIQTNCGGIIKPFRLAHISRCVRIHDVEGREVERSGWLTFPDVLGYQHRRSGPQARSGWLTFPDVLG